LTNIGTENMTVNSVSLPSGVFAQTNGCLAVSPLAPSASCTISVTFTPTAAEAYAADLSIGTSDAVSPTLTVSLSGTGVAQVLEPVATLSTASVDLGSVNVGATSEPELVTLTNTGTAPLTVNSVTVSTGVFAQTNNCPAALDMGVSCTISVTFTPSLLQPTVSQLYTGSLSIDTNDPANGIQSVSLTGTGVWLPPAAPTNLTGSAVRLAQGAPNRNTVDQVSLSWTDNANNEAGFVIQRAQVTNSCTNATFANVGTTGPNQTSYGEQATRTGNLCYRVQAQNPGGVSTWSNVLFLTTP
jgi:hypothetical protein